MASKNNQSEPMEMRHINISLLGGSSSGKTSFFQGILESLTDDILVLNKDNNINLMPIIISRGVSPKKDSDEIQEQVLTVNQTEEDPELSNPYAAMKTMDSVKWSSPTAETLPPPTKQKNVNDVDRDITVSAKDRTAESMKLADQLRKMFRIIPEDGFQDPTATVRYVNITFHVLLNGKAKCLLTVTDYAGELIDSASDENKSTMVNMLATYIDSSDAAILLANVRELNNHIQDIYKADECMFKLLPARNALSADNVNSIMRALQKKNFSILLALTQTDSPTIDERLSNNQFARTKQDLKSYVYRMAFISAKNKKWSTGVIPVTALGRKRDGTPNVNAFNNEVLKDADLHQKNIDISVLFCLYNAIMGHMSELQEELGELKKNFLQSVFRKKEEKEKIALLKYQLNQLNELRTALTSKPDLFADVFEPEMPLEIVENTEQITVKGSAT